MVHIVAEHRCDAYGEEREHGKDRLCRLTHVAHVAVGHECHDRNNEHGAFGCLVVHEVEHEGCSSHNEHDGILHDGHRWRSPERVGGHLCEREVTLQHVYGILLEGEDGRIVEHAEQRHEPEAA